MNKALHCSDFPHVKCNIWFHFISCFLNNIHSTHIWVETNQIRYKVIDCRIWKSCGPPLEKDRLKGTKNLFSMVQAQSLQDKRCMLSIIKSVVSGLGADVKDRKTAENTS